MKYTTKAQLHRAMGDVYDFCAGTVFEGKEWECVSYNGCIQLFPPAFEMPPGNYEFALGIVEDKLVWEGNTNLYNTSGANMTAQYWWTQKWLDEHKISWTPPAPPKPKLSVEELKASIAELQKELLEIWDKEPKTVTVELLLEDAQRVLHCLDMYEVPVAIIRAKEAVKLAIAD